MRIHVISASAVVQHTLERIVIASGNEVGTPADAERVLTNHLHTTQSDTPTIACVTLSSRTSAAIQSFSIPVKLPALLRALRAPAALQPLPLGNQWQLDITERRATHPTGASVSFTEKECELLTMLMTLQPSPIPREALLAKVWGIRHDVDTHTLETHIYRLRQKLEHTPPLGEIITEEGTYRLVTN